VGGKVAELNHIAKALLHFGVHRFDERLVVDEGGEVVFIWKGEVLVVVVEPLDGGFCGGAALKGAS
jgi:hypothetical protein